MKRRLRIAIVGIVLMTSAGIGARASLGGLKEQAAGGDDTVSVFANGARHTAPRNLNPTDVVEISNRHLRLTRPWLASSNQKAGLVVDFFASGRRCDGTSRSFGDYTYVAYSVLN